MTDYLALSEDVEALVRDVPHKTACLANAAALLYMTLPDVLWAGFYLMEKGTLVLGPFQGKPACVQISVGEGVCGTAALRRESVLVENVHTFSGHIACDSASNSEIVVPILVHGEVVGVLDMDSATLGRFSKQDQTGLEQVVRVLERHVFGGDV